MAVLPQRVSIAPTAVCASQAFDRRLLKHKIPGVEVRNFDILQPNRAPALCTEVDHGRGAVGGDAQIVETRNVGERAEIDQVVPVGEVLDGVVAVPRLKHEGVVAFIARVVAFIAIERVVALTAIERVVALTALERVVALTAIERVSTGVDAWYSPSRAASPSSVSLPSPP